MKPEKKKKKTKKKNKTQKQGFYPNDMTSWDHHENTWKVKKKMFGIKLQEELHSQATQIMSHLKVVLKKEERVKK